jgi:hypothetical protein
MTECLKCGRAHCICDLAPQAESQRVELVHQMRSLTGHGEWQQTDADGETSIKRMPHWADLYEFRTLQVIAPQAATTASAAAFQDAPDEFGDKA